MRNIVDILKQRDAVVKTAITIFNETGKLEATFYMTDSSNNHYLMPANDMMANGATKNLLSFIIKKIISDKNIETVVFCTEAWVSTIDLNNEKDKSKLDENGNPNIVPSQDPERKEILMVTTECKEFGLVDFSCMEISRDESGKPTLGEIKKMNGMDEMSGRFIHFMKPEPTMQN